MSYSMRGIDRSGKAEPISLASRKERLVGKRSPETGSEIAVDQFVLSDAVAATSQKHTLRVAEINAAVSSGTYEGSSLSISSQLIEVALTRTTVNSSDQGS